MSSEPVFFEDMAAQVEIPQDGITSRALHNDDHTRVVLFGFDTGQELSEHTASMPAIVQILRGEGILTLGDVAHEVGPGSWAHMPANLSHSIVARKPLVMLLTMNKAAKRASE